MKVRVLAIGPKMPGWVQQATDEYIKRLPRELPLEFIPLALGNRAKNQSAASAIAQEGDAMLNAIRDKEQVVALDLSGKSWSTRQVAEKLEGWQLSGKDLVFLIGGPDGLDPRCLARADERWCLSNLTLPHPLVRVLLAEQFYRAWTITKNHPYHK